MSPWPSKILERDTSQDILQVHRSNPSKNLRFIPSKDPGSIPIKDHGSNPSKNLGFIPSKDPGSILGKDHVSNLNKNIAFIPGKDLRFIPSKDLGSIPRKDHGFIPSKDHGFNPNKIMGLFTSRVSNFPKSFKNTLDKVLRHHKKTLLSSTKVIGDALGNFPRWIFDDFSHRRPVSVKRLIPRE
ncbi:hypothetical protein L2E82_51345 [Cichorium intybus]|nr:hypothetical protein L2E82_51345 [Cichorium intybus]